MKLAADLQHNTEPQYANIDSDLLKKALLRGEQQRQFLDSIEHFVRDIDQEEWKQSLTAATPDRTWGHL